MSGVSGASVSAGGGSAGVDLGVVLDVVRAGPAFVDRIGQLEAAKTAAQVAQAERAQFEQDKAAVAQERQELEQARAAVAAERTRYENFWKRIELIDKGE